MKRGLAYSVVSFFGAEKYQGSFQIVMQTKNPSAREAIGLALKEMELIRKEPVSEEGMPAGEGVSHRKFSECALTPSQSLPIFSLKWSITGWVSIIRRGIPRSLTQ